VIVVQFFVPGVIFQEIIFWTGEMPLLSYWGACLGCPAEFNHYADNLAYDSLNCKIAMRERQGN